MGWSTNCDFILLINFFECWSWGSQLFAIIFIGVANWGVGSSESSQGDLISSSFLWDCRDYWHDSVVLIFYSMIYSDAIFSIYKIKTKTSTIAKMLPTILSFIVFGLKIFLSPDVKKSINILYVLWRNIVFPKF